MAPRAEQSRLFPDDATDTGIIFVNERCRLQTQGGYRLVTVAGVPSAQYTVGDRMSEAMAMVNLVGQGWAQQKEVAHAFSCSERTVRRYQQRYDSGGIQALGRPSGYPKGRPRLPATRTEVVNLWKEQGISNREIARRLGVCEKAVRKLLRRLGWKQEQPEQLSLSFDLELPGSGQRHPDGQAVAAAGAGAEAAEGSIRPGSADADPNLSGPGSGLAEQEAAGAAGSAAEAVQDAEGSIRPGSAGADPNLSAPGSGLAEQEAVGSAGSAAEAVQDAEGSIRPGSADADPNLSGPASIDDWLPSSLDDDPSDRCFDRTLACLGLLDDAAPLFGSGSGVPGLGVLLALPAIVESGVVQIAREVYGSIGPAFYGLRTTIILLVFMALLRIKRPEHLKERSPNDLGQILGLDRAPEVKTLRRKLARLASFDRAAEFGHALAKLRVALRGHAMGFLYVDGHVRAYHGKRSIPKTHVGRLRISMPATTDYWVNDAEGEPLFVVNTEANKGLVKMLPEVLDEVRSLVGDRRVTVIFDRGGWSPKLFKKLIAKGFDIMTYRKGRSRRVAKRRFSEHQATIDGCQVRYLLADQNVLLLKRQLRLRQITRLSPNGHQTAILTSRFDLPAIEVAYRMFERWRQENFFKYLREEYALDALVDYGVEPADPTRSVPNPKRKEIDAELHRARAQLAQIEAEYGLEALDNTEKRRRTMRVFKIANSSLAKRINEAMRRVTKLEERRARVPARVPVQEVVEGEVIQLAAERKHLSDLLKMVAYQAESDLVRILHPHYQRSDQEGRTLIQNALASTGDITVTETELHVALQPLSSPHRTQALAALCEQLNETKTRFPGSRLDLHFTVQREPSPSMAFPGPRPSNHHSKPGQPDSQNTV